VDLVATTTKSCTKCGAKLPSAAQYCGYCGSSFTQQQPRESPAEARCPICGTEVTANVRFCGYCGAAVTKDGGATPPQGRKSVVQNVAKPKEVGTRPTEAPFRPSRSFGAATSVFRERLHVIIPVATCIVLAAAVWWWWSARPTVPSSSASQQSATASQPLPRAKLMTEDQDFVWLLECDINCYAKTEQLVKFSPSWQQADKEAAASTVGITDPEMKAQAWRNKFDEIKNKFGGDDVFRAEGAAEIKKRLHQYVQEHKDDLFQVARFDSYNSSQQVLKVNPSFGNNNVSMVNVSLVEMDAVLTRFRVIEASAIDQQFHELKAGQPAITRAFEEAGMRTEIPSDAEERRIAEGIVLSQHVLLAAKGDPAEPRMDVLYLVNSPSGVILTQLSKGVVKSATVSQPLAAPPGSQSNMYSSQMTAVIRYTPPTNLPDTGRKGSCWTGSIAASYRPDAWRCMEGNGIYDPCFSLPDQKAVVCDANPPEGKAGFKLDLTEPLPLPGRAPSGQPWPWLVELTDGTTCNQFTGTMPQIDGQSAHYGCTYEPHDQESLLVGDLDTSKLLWTAQRASLVWSGSEWSLKSSKSVPVKAVWQ
jgi:hypothetical protein